MPLYGYKCDCTDCGLHFDALLPYSDSASAKCPHCGWVGRKVPTAPGNYKISGDNSASTRPKTVVKRRKSK